MNEEGFVTRRRQEWTRLAAMCDAVDSQGPAALHGEALREFIRLYRQASTDLAVVRTSSRNLPLVENLNDLVARAYGLLYTSPKKGFLQSIRDALVGSAETVRARWGFVLCSASIFFGSAVFASIALNSFPNSRLALIPDGVRPLFQDWQKGRFKGHDSSESTAMAGFYASNNPRVAVIAGAVGAGTMGVGSIYLLFQNGSMLGSLAHEMNAVGKLGFLVASIVPHGIPELSGAIVAGSAGLLLGWALINPGRRSRGDSLRKVGKDAFVLIVTSVCLMFIAAPIEAFFSFDPAVPTWLKGCIGALEFVAWGLFWTTFGRPETA